MGRYRRSFWMGVPLLVSCAANGAAAADPAQQPGPPVFDADVALVAVPVFVTDKSGKAVRGLTAEHFEVEDGGRRAPIVAFQAIDVDAPAAAGAATRSELPVAVQAAAPRQFLLLFDMVFSPRSGTTRARTAASRFVRESLAPSDLVAVGTFRQTGLQMLTNFTSDHAYVARVIEKLGLVSTLGSDPLALSGDLGMSGASTTLVDQELAAQGELLTRALKSEYRRQVTNFLMTVADLAKALASLGGRKQIVLLSGGVAEWAWAGAAPRGRPRRGLEAAPVFAKMKDVFRMASQSDVVIHAISLAGLEGPVDVSSQTGKQDRRDEGRGALAALAANTGGQFILPTNDFGLALGQVDQISRHSYVIAFEAAHPADKPGRPRKLKVRVRGEGLSVSHRAAYVLPSSSSVPDAGAVRLRAAEAIAKGLSSGPLGLHLVAMPYRERDGKPSAQAVLHIDGPGLADAAQGGPLAVQVYGYALVEGRVLDTLALNTTLDLSKVGTSVRSSGLRVLTAFAVPPGAVDLRFFVRAGPSATGSIQRNVQVPAFAEGETVLSPPMSTLPLPGNVVAPYRTRNQPQAEIPFHLGNERFVPAVAVALEPERARDLCVFVWRPRKGAADPLEVTGEIVRPGEAPLPMRLQGGPRVTTDADGFDRYVVTVVPPAAPGGYTLRLAFRDSGTGQTTGSEIGVALEK